ncbi:unnamed protein product [Prunus armeniaca]|uniref:Uncharacterized protein n=1 Tax=Prunus armeniaca TaxID=36596 RepID=A0A6J5VFS2_PRUAR|nr:unnamed protein product [Prunus armeniaca]
MKLKPNNEIWLPRKYIIGDTTQDTREFAILHGHHILALKSKEPAESIYLNKETGGSCSNRSENNSDIKLDISRTPAIDSPQAIDRTLFSSSLIRPRSSTALSKHIKA